MGLSYTSIVDTNLYAFKHRKKYRIPSPGFTLDFVQRSQVDPRISQVDRLLTKFTVDLVVINLGSLYKIQAGNTIFFPVKVTRSSRFYVFSVTKRSGGHFFPRQLRAVLDTL